MSNPKFLYHASQNRNINRLEPSAIHIRDPKEGPLIFATPDKVMATIFLVPSDDSWTNSGLFGGVHYFVCSDEMRFREVDKGGAIYTLPSETFHSDPTKGLGALEWVSKETVKPVGKIEYESGLEAMLAAGVQVYFISKEEFEELKKSDDHGNKILRENTSENQKRNRNIKKLPTYLLKLANG